MEQKIKKNVAIGDNLKRLRKNNKYSQEKLCAELQLMGCDIGRTTYAKYEYAELNVRADVLCALTKLYDCSFDEFFVGI